MKTIVFADTHLSSRCYSKKFNYLKSIIEPADRVVIAGDFWDGFLTSFDKFVQSPWSRLFPLLLERQTIYLYGNHDRVEWSNDQVKLFSVQQAMTTDLTIGHQTYHICHGHTVFTSLEDKYPIFNHSIPLRLGANADVLHKLVWGKRFLSKKNSKINQPMREWTTHNSPRAAFLICGHSHFPEINRHQGYANTGFIGMGYGNYLILDTNGVQLVKDRY